MTRRDRTCPHCSQTWNGIIGPGGRRTIVRLERQETQDINNYDSYVCPECGYTEFFRVKK